MSNNSYNLSQKNCGIELLRFIFAILIVLGHAFSSFQTEGLPGWIVQQGAIGVEFFFILSGILMAKSLSKFAENSVNYEQMANDTITFLKKKYCAVYPTHIITFIILFFEEVIITNLGLMSSLITLVSALPEILLFQMSGIRLQSINPNDWYISAMLLAMLIIYPLLRKYETFYAKCIGPVITLVILGYCCMTTQTITPSVTPMLGGIAMKGTLRAIAEISLGISTYEVIKYINHIPFKPLGAFLLHCIELFCYISTFFVACTDTQGAWYFVFMFILAIGLSISFSKWSIFANIKNSNVSLYLGELSMTIFLCQRIVLYPLETLRPFDGYWINTGIFLLGTLILSVIMKTIIDLLVKNKDFWKHILIY